MENKNYDFLEQKLTKRIKWDLNFGYDENDIEELSSFGYDFGNFNLTLYNKLKMEKHRIFMLKTINTNIKITKRVTYSSLENQNYDNFTDMFLCSFYMNAENDINFIELMSIN